ncbi:MAG: hypothetical protein WCC25_16560, partial [Candidatus Korobacteraceae bacterium]
MKSLIGLRIRMMLLALGIASLSASSVVAQQSDAEHSTVQILMGSNSDLQTVGFARVSGVAKINAAEPSESMLDISAHLPEGESLRFKSKRVDLRADGKLEVSGEMRLTRVEHEVNIAPAEDYRGAIVGAAVTHTVAREVRFVIPLAGVEKGEAIAEADLGLENFPQLFAAVREANLHPVIEDERCVLSQAGEDYRGAD